MPRFNQNGTPVDSPERYELGSVRWSGRSSASAAAATRPSRRDLLYDYVLGADRQGAAARALRADRGRRRRRDAVVRSTSASRGRAEVAHLRTFPWPPAEPARARALAGRDLRQRRQHGEHARDLARARHRRAAARGVGEGVVLCGASAGMICWFEAGVTDSFGPQLEAMDCLGFLAGSACPHYDGEERRRPRYRELVDGGLPGGHRRRRRRRRSTTSAPSCARSSRAARARPPTASRATARSGSTRGCSEADHLQ